MKQDVKKTVLFCHLLMYYHQEQNNVIFVSHSLFIIPFFELFEKVDIILFVVH